MKTINIKEDEENEKETNDNAFCYMLYGMVVTGRCVCNEYNSKLEK